MYQLSYLINDRVIESEAVATKPLAYWKKKQKQLSGRYQKGKLIVKQLKTKKS
jgi:hypothetical protein